MAAACTVVEVRIKNFHMACYIYGAFGLRSACEAKGGQMNPGLYRGREPCLLFAHHVVGEAAFMLKNYVKIHACHKPIACFPRLSPTN